MKPLSRARFLIPNLFTLGNILCGYLCIINSIKGNIPLACNLVLLGAFLDLIDGLSARRLNSQSKFGLEFDSLADMVSFGLGPAFIALYLFSQAGIAELGAFFGFVYLSGISVRLARFNSGDAGILHFRGLPSPAAAITVTALSYLLFQSEASETSTSVFLAIWLSLSSILCVSRVVYISFKTEVKLSFFQKFLLAITLGSIAFLGWSGIFILSTLYAISGPAILVGRLLKPKSLIKIALQRGDSPL